MADNSAGSNILQTSITLENESKQSETSIIVQDEDPHRINSTVTCVVKSSKIPLTYSRLDENTNLHQPPSNWLKSGTHISARNTWVKGGSWDFSSFSMANQRPEKVGEVDVISASENIKKLLKIPFSSNQVSMAVHRVANTLLLDELDLLKELRSASELGRDWVKECLLRRVLQDGQMLTKERKTNEVLQNQNLLSKFLCYSVGDQDTEGLSQEDGQARSVMPLVQSEIHQEGTSFARQVLWEFEDICMLIGSDLPIFGEGKYPAVSLRLRDTTSPINILTGMDYWLDNLMCNVPELVMCYHLNGIVQKYEMLKTEEIPHLENAKFSTKVVKDIAQNILSFLKRNCTKEGHTYWLYKGKDDDVVKLYDLTSLCGNSANCPWDNPFIVPVALLLYRVAKNMFKMNPNKQSAVISKLLKECVKLLQESGDTHPEISSSAYYMLTLIHINDKYDSPTKGPPRRKASLSPTNSCEGDEIMMPEVKCNELMSPTCQTEQETTFKSPKRKENVMDKNVTTLEYIIKGLKYVHSSKSTQYKIPLPLPEHYQKEKEGKLEKTLEKKSTTSADKMSSPKATDQENSGTKLALIPSEIFQKKSEDFGGIASSQREQDNNLPGFTDRNENSRNLDDDIVPTDQSCQALSVTEPQSSLVQTDNNLETQTIEDKINIGIKHFPVDSWQMEVQVSLLTQAAQVYHQLAEEQLANKWYGTALLYSKIGLKCDATKSSNLSKDPTIKEQKLVSHHLWMICGDALLLMMHDPSSYDRHQEDFHNVQENHAYILAAIQGLISPDEHNLGFELSREKDSSLRSSIQCYTNALKDGQNQSPAFLVSVARKIGNAKNELGSYLMNTASQLYKQRKGIEVTPEESKLWQQSLSCFEKGIEAFEEVEDEANTALLMCNSGRLMRLCAQGHSNQGSAGPVGQLSESEMHYFKQAFKYYEQSLSRLGRRKKSPQIWDAVSWELCTAEYSLGCLLQDHPPLQTTPQEQVERDILKYFTNALRRCDSEGKSAINQPLYQYRIASIHHRLASMYHNIYRSQVVSQKQRRTHTLVELHYNKAFTYFMQQERHLEVLRIQLERVAVLEHQLAAHTGHSTKTKSFQSIFEMLITSVDSLNALRLRCALSDQASSRKSHNKEESLQVDELDQEERRDISKLIPLMESRLKVNFLAIIKHLSSKKGNHEKGDAYKKLCSEFFASTHSSANSDEITAGRIQKVIKTLKDISSLIKKLPLN